MGRLKTTAVQPAEFRSFENKAPPSHLVPRENLQVRAGDILLTCAGPRSRCGVACLVREIRPRLLFSGKMYRFRAKPGVMDSDFLEAYLQTSYVWQSIDRMKTGGSDSGLNLTHDRFRQLPVPIAPISEQRRVAKQLHTLLLEIGEGEAALAEARKDLEIFRRALLKAAVTGELTKDWRDQNPVAESGNELVARIIKDRVNRAKRRVGSDNESPSIDLPISRELPEHWGWSTMGELFDVSTGSTPSRSDPSLWNGDVPWVSSGEVAFCRIRSTDETISLAGLGNPTTRLNPPGTVLLQ
jgi:type I restriction enzyme, S subunit